MMRRRTCQCMYTQRQIRMVVCYVELMWHGMYKMAVVCVDVHFSIVHHGNIFKKNHPRFEHRANQGQPTMPGLKLLQDPQGVHYWTQEQVDGILALKRNFSNAGDGDSPSSQGLMFKQLNDWILGGFLGPNTGRQELQLAVYISIFKRTLKQTEESIYPEK